VVLGAAVFGLLAYYCRAPVGHFGALTFREPLATVSLSGTESSPKQQKLHPSDRKRGTYETRTCLLRCLGLCCSPLDLQASGCSCDGSCQPLSFLWLDISLVNRLAMASHPVRRAFLFQTV